MGSERGFKSAAWFDDYRRKFLDGAAPEELEHCRITKAERGSRVADCIMVTLITGVFSVGMALAGFWVGFIVFGAIVCFVSVPGVYFADDDIFSVARATQLRQKLEERRATQSV